MKITKDRLGQVESKLFQASSNINSTNPVR